MDNRYMVVNCDFNDLNRSYEQVKAEFIDEMKKILCELSAKMLIEAINSGTKAYLKNEAPFFTTNPQQYSDNKAKKDFLTLGLDQTFRWLKNATSTFDIGSVNDHNCLNVLKTFLESSGGTSVRSRKYHVVEKLFECSTQIGIILMNPLSDDKKAEIMISGTLEALKKVMLASAPAKQPDTIQINL